MTTLENVHFREPLLRFSAVAAGVTVLSNILWAIFSGPTRDVFTITGVLAFATASGLHAYVSFGRTFVIRFFAVTMTTTFIAEVIGVRTGFPFGVYEYDLVRLGQSLFDVPLLIPFAWFMMLYPSWVIVNGMVKNKIFVILLGALLMATWDLYLDPQMVNEGYWTWFIDGVPGKEIPISNFFGWLLTALIIFTLISTFAKPPAKRISNFVPYALMLWVWLGSFLVNIVPISPFLNQPSVAWSGLIGMGIVLLPWAWLSWQRR